MELRELMHLPIFEDATDDELEWLLKQSEEVNLAPGSYFLREGERSDSFYVVLEGELQITRTLNGQSTVMGTTPRGIIGGEQALLNGTPSEVSAQAIMTSRLMVLRLPAFRAMFVACPTVGAKVLRIAAERTRGLATTVKQQEKMAALGKLSAGLAHELNNPAAATRSATRALREALPALQNLSLQLGCQGITTTHLQALEHAKASAEPAAAALLSTLDRADREDEVGAWLDEQGIAESWELAPDFVSCGLSRQSLEALAAALPAEALAPALAWLRQSLSAASLLAEIEQSTERISQLVGAVKAYTFMDQSTRQEVDLNHGLETTLIMLKHKLKNVQVTRTYDPNLPKIQAHGGELNQVWTNIIDNAIDAMHGEGALQLITRCEHNFAMVEVTDNGPGIPASVLPRIFEPFFTTKEVGVGTGLGLDISYRIIQQHGGSIEVQSQPGNTRFIIRLPVQ